LHNDLKQRTNEKPGTIVSAVRATGDEGDSQPAHSSELTQRDTVPANLSWPNIDDTSLQDFANPDVGLFTQDLTDWPEFLQMLDLDDPSTHNGPFG